MSGAVGLAAAARAAGAGQPAGGAGPSGAEGQAAPVVTVAFVLRHAETTGTLSDPSLSQRGRERATRIGLMLRGVGAQRVLHSATTRAQETAQEITRVIKAGSGSYDLLDPGPVIGRIVERGGVWIIVGHSNTVPDLVRRLGGDAGTDLLPEGSYDQVFMVVRAGEGAITVPLYSV
tara:strand:+ start:11083 stop:11610 length:528 start_codon:yes stop_codon:yes gene_type:complete